MKHFTLFGLTAGALLAVLPLSGASAQTTYQFTDFSASAAGLPTTVNGLSNSGVTVGFYVTTNPDTSTANTNFIGTPGAITPLDLSALAVPNAASANGINSSGLVVGFDGANGAFVLDTAHAGSTPAPLPLADLNATAETANGINDSGTIVGNYSYANSAGSMVQSGFVEIGGAFTALDPTGTAGFATAQGISGNGLVIGYYGPNGLTTSGFLFDTATGAYTLLADPTVSDLAFTQFLGINNSGVAVGYYQTKAGFQHGFLYNTQSAGTDPYTFLDDPAVAGSETSMMQITGIADSGEIAGFYATPDGSKQLGFIATPAAVPEASSVVSLAVLLLLGAGGVAAAKRRKVAA